MILYCNPLSVMEMVILILCWLPAPVKHHRSGLLHTHYVYQNNHPDRTFTSRAKNTNDESKFVT